MATPQEPLRGEWVTVQREVANWAENALHFIATTGQAPAWATGYDARGKTEAVSIELGKAVGRQGFDTPDPLADIRAWLGTYPPALGETAGDPEMTIVEFLRRVISQDGTGVVPGNLIPTHLAHRGSDVETFIKRARDQQEPMTEPHDVLDGLLDDYRDHADTGTPLGEEVVGPHED